MSLYIRDPKVDALAGELMQRLGAKSKTEAVRRALENELKRENEKVPLAERVRKYQRAIAALGPADPTYDHKAHMDEDWEI
ncbi:type II toxin-antitoxin system VapB family antitoxin [Rhizobium sp. SGZ-381]|uniref:type II toxin-antitoxin system VapB family antitoxin n=1 Tax=Rhizobium sp. SGZ-381 TaxID=3342800 RepID=UPI003671582E